MKRLCVFLACLVLVGVNLLQAQTVRITGTVTSSEDGMPIPGVSVVVKGTTTGGITNVDGKYELNIAASAQTLVFSFVGMKTQEIAIGGRAVIDIVLQSESLQVDEVVVTALGISRTKKSLGYATQEVKGDAVTAVKANNFMNSLSGKVSGVQIKKNTNMGGSTNVIVRGNKSLSNNNQVLYVVDGVPITNNISNISAQSTGGVGYDYGNTASDINPEDIESINILKGSAATALYGSRGNSGVVLIVTKKGAEGKKGIGVTVNSNVTIGSIDKSTFPTYQDKYGAGYGAYYGPAGTGWFEQHNASGGSTGTMYDWVPTTEDASYGAKFDGHEVYGWYSLDPESPWYGQTKPWQAAKNGPVTFFETPVSYTNSVSIDNSFDKGSYRISYTNNNMKGILPNSSMHKNSFSLNSTYKVTDKLTATVNGTYIVQKAIGRNSTGYNDNIMSGMRQWWEVNTDLKDQKTVYDLTHRNVTWNYDGDFSTLKPIYWDNVYFTRYQNYENDGRNRFMGNTSIQYKLAKWLDVTGRIAADSYSEIQEERRAVGSIPTTFGVSRTNQGSGYLRRDNTFSEVNYDLMLNFNKNLTEDLNLTGVIGFNERRTNASYFTNSTNGGLNVPGIYAIGNSKDPLPYPVESVQNVGVRSMYASASLGYKGFLFLDGTFREDYASTLPSNNSKYYYPSVTGSFLFTDIVKQSWLSLGKVRLNWAKVGNLAPYDALVDKYNVSTSFNGAMYVLPNTKNNPDLKSESTISYEAGLEMSFMKNRFGFDVSLYQQNSKDQIMPVSLSQTTGYAFKYVNAGEIRNRGIELTLKATPVKLSSFSWDINVNFAKNQNEVLSLYPGITNLQLGSFQGGVTLNAQVGQPYGALQGTDYTYYQGQKILSATTGKPVKSTTASQVIGNVNPDWTGGISNSFTYKSFSLSFLIDVQKGGDIFSLDMYYGLSSGLYPETAGLNDLGNPVRDPRVGTPGNYAANSGGYINQGVNVVRDASGNITSSTPNVTRVSATTYAGFGYSPEPNKAFIYDAGFVKLREVSLSYNLPSAIVNKLLVKGITVSFVGSNLWIIHKNLPYADPESGLSAGNIQGYSIGSLPSTRDFGFNVKINF
jgi:TonB-linked SusC/RagA family outer membrane protein